MVEPGRVQYYERARHDVVIGTIDATEVVQRWLAYWAGEGRQELEIRIAKALAKENEEPDLWHAYRYGAVAVVRDLMGETDDGH
jgi:hypothetical protein